MAYSDYGVIAPTVHVVLSVDDEAVVEVQLWLTKQRHSVRTFDSLGFTGHLSK